MNLTESQLSDLLQNIVGVHDMEWIVYHLVQGAVSKRNEADDGTNKADKEYWQKAVSALIEFQTKLEEM